MQYVSQKAVWSGVAGMKGPLRVPDSLFDLKEEREGELDGWAAFLSFWSWSNKSRSRFYSL